MKRKKLRRDSLTNSITYLKEGKLVDHKEAITQKKLGINLLLVDLADDAAHRLHRISETLRISEEIIFSKDYIQKLPPDEVLSIWKQLTKCSDKERQFVSALHNYLDWDDMSLQLDLCTKSNTPPPAESGARALREDSAEILSLLSRLDAKKKSETK